MIFVGGYGSEQNDGAFDSLAPLFPPDRFDVVRFGDDPRFPYDTYGSIEPSAAALIGQVRDARGRYEGVNLVSHSLGGVVVDHAFGDGLSAHDGVRTDVAIAGPHNGSSFAWVPTVVFGFVGPVKDIVRAAVLAMPFGRDPDSQAARDLATARPIAPPEGIVRLDVSLASDGFVNEFDASDPGVEQRVYLPASFGELIDGHGGSLTNRQIAHVVAATVIGHQAPVDDRSAVARLIAGILWIDSMNFFLVTLAAAALAAIVLAVLRTIPACRILIDLLANRCHDFVRGLGR